MADMVTFRLLQRVDELAYAKCPKDGLLLGPEQTACPVCGTPGEPPPKVVPFEALAYALKIIMSYQSDIERGYQGVDLQTAGFCQGEIYRLAVRETLKLAGLLGEPNAKVLPTTEALTGSDPDFLRQSRGE